MVGARQWLALYQNYIFCYLIFYQTCRRIIKYAFNTFNTALEGPKHLVTRKEKLKRTVIGLAHFFSLFDVNIKRLRRVHTTFNQKVPNFVAAVYFNQYKQLQLEALSTPCQMSPGSWYGGVLWCDPNFRVKESSTSLIISHLLLAV